MGKTIAQHIPESVAHLFLRITCCLLQGLQLLALSISLSHAACSQDHQNSEKAAQAHREQTLTSERKDNGPRGCPVSLGGGLRDFAQGLCFWPAHAPRSSSCHMVALYRAILRYYRCNTPRSSDTFSVSPAPQQGAIPAWYFVSDTNLGAMPQCATYCMRLVQYPSKTSTNGFAIPLV